MSQQPKTVVCTSCDAKFHVPDDLIRGKLVKFRCRKCGSAIDVDGRARGRTGAEPPFRQSEPPFRHAEPAVVDTPAAFSQQAEPGARPPIGWTKSSPNHPLPWLEPPPVRSTVPPPMSISESVPPEATLPDLEMVRDPSNRWPKIAAVAALLIAAGLSGVGLAIRNPAPTSIASHESKVADPVDPQPAAHARAAAQRRGVDPSLLTRAPTAVTDLPLATDGVDRAHTGAAAAPPAAAVPKLAETAAAKLETPPTEMAAPAATLAVLGEAPAAAAVPAPAATANVGSAVARGELAAAQVDEKPGAASQEGPTAGATPGNPMGAANVAAATAPTALAPGAAVQPAANPPAVAPPSSPPAMARSKSDFNTQAAREALEDAAARASRCKTIDTPSGTARVAVTFAANGQATNAVIESGPFVGTSAGTCVAAKFRAARVPPFSGDSVLVRKSVPF
jgi:predicted RNA-binding Zn-ribbon protein involved in translation (DUF1610 family)